MRAASSKKSDEGFAGRDGLRAETRDADGRGAHGETTGLGENRGRHQRNSASGVASPILVSPGAFG